MKLETSLLEVFACPVCRAPLAPEPSADDAHELVCTSADCGRAYPIRDSIPVLLADEARMPGTSSSGAAE